MYNNTRIIYEYNNIIVVRVACPSGRIGDGKELRYTLGESRRSRISRSYFLIIMYRVVLGDLADSRWRISENTPYAYYADYQLLIQDLGLKNY